MRDPLLERTLPCRDLAQERVRRDLQIRTRRRPPGGRIRPRPAGGDSLQRLIALVRRGGRVAYPNGVEPEPRTPRQVELVPYDAEASPREFARLDHAVESARLRVPIASVRPLAEAAQAHERIEKGHVLGRIVLQIRSTKQLRFASKV